MVRRSWLLGVGLLLWAPACADRRDVAESELDGEGSGGAEPGGDDDRTDGLPPVAEIVIPMRPRSSGDLYSVLVLSEDGGGPRLQFDASLTLAAGDGYPAEFTATLPDRWWATCGSGGGALRLSSPATSGDAVAVALADPSTIVVSDYRPGETTSITAQGEVILDEDTCELAAGTSVSIDFTLSIAVKAVAGARIEPPCAEPVVIAPSAANGPADQFGWSWFRATLIDADDEPFVADNAEADAQLDVRLRGSFDAAHAAPDELQSWVAPSQPGFVEITPVGGATLMVDVVDASRIIGATLDFQIAGAAAGSLIVEDGESYDGWARKANRLAPMVRELVLDGRPLCSEPDPSWFSVETLTPETCSIVDLPGPSQSAGAGYLLDGDRVGAAGRLDQDGRCELMVRAPRFATSAGFPVGFSATFLNVASLLD